MDSVNNEYTFHVLNLCLSLLTCALFLVILWMKDHSLDVLPKSLKMFFKLSLGCASFLPLGTIISTLTFLSGSNKWILAISDLVVTFSSHYIRFAYLIIFFERTFAVIFTRTFDRFTVKRFGVVMFSITLGLAVAFTLPNLLLGPQYIGVDIWVVAVAHLVLTVVHIKLLCRYSLLHRSLLFNPTLKGRYQIIENIRILRRIKLYIFMMLFFSPIAPLISFFIYTSSGQVILSPIIPTGYNMCFTLCLFGRICQLRQRRKIGPTDNVQTVDTVTDGAF